MASYSSGLWDWSKDVSIEAKIEYLKERFSSSNESAEAICVRSLIEEYNALYFKLKDVKK
jgi:hypothetical protein